MTEVHGLPEPPEGCEWHVGYPGKETGEAHKIISIVARRKWTPKPGEEVKLRSGERVVYGGDMSKVGYCDTSYCHAVLTEDGRGEFCCLDEIIGPWIDEAESPADEPVIDDIGEGYTRIVWDAENPPVRMNGDEFQSGDCWFGITPYFGTPYTASDFSAFQNRRRPIARNLGDGNE